MCEELFEPAQLVKAETLIINPFTGKTAYNSIVLNAMSFVEVYAEKFRAALTRKEPAIRDFYDIFYAIRKENLDTNDHKLLDFIQKKLQVPGNENLNFPLYRKDELEKQLDTQLKPVLRKIDFEDFDLYEAIDFVAQIAHMMH